MVRLGAVAVSLLAVSLLAVASGGRSSGAEISFRGDWDTGDAKQWTGLQRETDRPAADSFNVVSSPVRQGSYGAQFVARHGYSPFGHNESVEAVWQTADQGQDSEYYYAWSTLFEDNWVSLPDWGKFVQFFSDRASVFGGGPPISFDSAHDRIEIDVHTGLSSVNDENPSIEYERNWVVSSSLNLGRWNDFVVHLRFAGDHTGLLEAWHRVAGEGRFRKVASADGIPTLRWNPAYGVDAIGSIKLGLYRKSYCDLPVELDCTSPQGIQPPSVLYQDGFTRGSSFGAVAEAAFGDLEAVSNLQASAGDRRVDLSWVRPDTPFDEIEVVRKVGSDPLDPGDGTPVYSGSGASFGDLGVENGVTYQYGVWVRYGSRLSPVARVEASPVLPPLVGVTGLQATPRNAGVDLGWTNPAIRFDRVIVTRKAALDPADPADPADGMLVYSGSGSSVSDTGLQNESEYRYAVWVERDGELSAPARASSTPFDPNETTYTAQPAGDYSGTSARNLGAVFHLTSDRTLLRLGRVYQAGSSASNKIGIWDEATETLLYSATVDLSAPVATLPVPLLLRGGKRYVLGIREQAGTRWSKIRPLTGLPPFLVVDDGAYNTAVAFSYPNLRNGTPGSSSEDWTMTFGPPAPSPDPVTGLQAWPGDGRVDLFWTNPFGTFDAARVVRKAGADPADPTDGTLVFDGQGSSSADTDLENDVDYHYAIWAVSGGLLSSPVRTTARPRPPTTYTSQPAGLYDGVAAKWTLGAVFHVTVDKTLTRVGRIYQDGSTAPNTIGIWDEATQALLFSATVGPGSPTADVPQLALRAGKRYVLGIKEAAGSPWSKGRQLTGLPPFLVIDDSAFLNSTAFGYPSGRDNIPGSSNEDWTLTFGAAIPPGPVTGVVATGGGGRIDLSWANPLPAFDEVEVVRKAESDPADPSDGSRIYSGSGSSFADLAVADGTTYHYGVWVRYGSYLPPPARARATPVPRPTVTGFTPTSGVPGTTVSISGSRLYGATAVTVGGPGAAITSNTATAVKVLVPAGAASGAIQVSTPGGTVTTPKAFTVKPSPSPSISGFTPTSGVPGTTVTISGSGLLGASSVKLAGVAAAITSNTATAVKVLVPAGAASGAIQVSTPGGTATTSSTFNVKLSPPPSIRGFTPTSGVPGATVTISGSGLLGASSVSISGFSATIVSDMASAVKVLVPAGAVTETFAVTTLGGTAFSKAAFTVKVSPPPVISGFKPTSGEPGSTVTISGSGLLAPTSVRFDGVEAAIVASSPGSIKAVVPVQATSGPIAVTTAGGTAVSAGSFARR
jgi:polysaccharide lyase-like protein/IPT/TIG domain-containing protein